MTSINAAPLSLTVRPEPQGGQGRAQLAQPSELLSPLGATGTALNAQEFGTRLPVEDASELIARDFATELDEADTRSVRMALASPSSPLSPLGMADPIGAKAQTQTASAEPQASRAYLLGSRAGSHAPDIKDDGTFWGPDGFQFSDLVDIVNPLQHIPVLSSLYRAITGDTIAPGAQVLGGGLLGGGIGFFASAAGAAAGQGAAAANTEQKVAQLTPEQVDAQIATLRTSTRADRFRQIAALQSYQQQAQEFAIAQAGQSPRDLVKA